MIDLVTASLLSISSVLAAAMLAVLVLRRMMHRLAGAEAAYAAWLLVPLSLLVLALPKVSAEGSGALQSAHTVVAVPAIDDLEADVGAPVASTWPRSAAAGTGWDSMAAILLAAWALGALALGGWMWRRHRRYVASLQPRRAGRPWRAAAGGQPGVFGAWRPRLALPLDFERRFGAEDRRLILAHERVHAQRGDPRWNVLAAALLAVQWCNPIAWWAHAAFRQDQEFACDAAVLRRRAADVARYARLLARGGDPASGSLLASHWPGRHPVVARVAMLRRHLRRDALWRLPVLLVVAVGAFGAAHAARPADTPAMVGWRASAEVSAMPQVPIVVDAGLAAAAVRVAPAVQRDLEVARHGPLPIRVAAARTSPAHGRAQAPAAGGAARWAGRGSGERSAAIDERRDQRESAAQAVPAIPAERPRGPRVAERPVAKASLSQAGASVSAAAQGASSPESRIADTAAVVPARVIDSDWRLPGSESLPPWPDDATPVQVLLVLSIDEGGRLVGGRVAHSPGEAYTRAALRWVRGARFGAARSASGERIASELPLLMTIAPPRWVTRNPAESG